MKNKFTSLLLLVPFAAFSQFINIPSNDFPVYTFNPANGTDHTTDVFNFYGDAVQTGFFTEETELWSYDATGPTNTFWTGLSDPNNNTSFFATGHDNTGALTWYIISQQTGAVGGGFGTSKMTHDPNTGNYLFCAEYTVPFVGYMLEFFSTSSGGASIPSTGNTGFVGLEVDPAGNIVSLCEILSSGAPVFLGDVDVDPNTGTLYATGYRQGGINQAFVIGYDLNSCSAVAGIAESAGVNSWGRGIDVENSQVFVVGDYETDVQWGGLSASAPGTQDVYVLELDAALNPVILTVAEAINYAEGYDIEVYPGATNIYVTGSIREESSNWPMGAFGLAPPGALHGFIQVFWPNIGAATCNYVQVLATGPGEFFKMVDIEENIEPVTPGFSGLMAIGGNMNHSGPVYDFYTGCALSASYPFTSTQPDVGFVLRVHDHPEPVWSDISTLQTISPAPTVTAVSSFEEDIFVGGYKNEDVTLAPSPIGDIIPNLGNSSMNAYFTYIYAPYTGTQGDFYKTTSTQNDQAEEAIRFAVYPNPANEVLYLRLDDAAALQQVRLKDLAGRTIQAWNGHEAVGGLAVGNIPAGIYLMEIEADGVRATERVVIQ
ncbi:MAG: T9SS type A sorting domain-containing protein [Leptolyngbya sp. SIO3F4]|nr:T9SS type A sorting domain-containing protein [Leptolyngbya sp. SIO3F4]